MLLPMTEHTSRTSRVMPPPSGVSALWARTRGVLRRLNSPDDTHAAAAVAALLLCAEAVLCLLIIAKVPCERPSPGGATCVSACPFLLVPGDAQACRPRSNPVEKRKQFQAHESELLRDTQIRPSTGMHIWSRWRASCRCGAVELRSC